MSLNYCERASGILDVLLIRANLDAKIIIFLLKLQKQNKISLMMLDICEMQCVLTYYASSIVHWQQQHLSIWTSCSSHHRKPELPNQPPSFQSLQSSFSDYVHTPADPLPVRIKATSSTDLVQSRGIYHSYTIMDSHDKVPVSVLRVHCMAAGSFCSRARRRITPKDRSLHKVRRKLMALWL